MNKFTWLARSADWTNRSDGSWSSRSAVVTVLTGFSRITRGT